MDFLLQILADWRQTIKIPMFISVMHFHLSPSIWLRLCRSLPLHWGCQRGGGWPVRADRSLLGEPWLRVAFHWHNESCHSTTLLGWMQQDRSRRCMSAVILIMQINSCQGRSHQCRSDRKSSEQHGGRKSQECREEWEQSDPQMTSLAEQAAL